MLTCKQCEQNLMSTQEFFSHIKYVHPRLIQVTCPHPNCSRFYSNRVSLRGHVNNTKIHCPIVSADESLSSKTSLLSESVVPLYKECVVVAEGNKTENGSALKIISDLKLEMMKHAVDLLSDELISRKKILEVLNKSFEYYSKYEELWKNTRYRKL